jgi:nucleoside-diphosphate-sugar epimerase
MHILIIGGTRNLGHGMVLALTAAGHQVTVFNRGITRDDLPAAIERLRGDRSEPDQLARAVRGRHFDAVIDNALYKAEEAREAVRIFSGRIGQYIFLSSGQVYLVREDIERPFFEHDYTGRLMPPPKVNTYGFEEWQYGMDKRGVEDVMRAAWETDRFPALALRLPMVNSERDHHNRLLAYILRLSDGGPLLVPSTPNYPLRHIYGDDVVRAIVGLVSSGRGRGEAYNLAQDETRSLDGFIATLAEVMGVAAAPIVRAKRSLLEANGFLPDCSPFSERWMSELDNTRSKTELGIAYTPLSTYLARIVAHHRAEPPPTPAGYRRRRAELLLIEQIAESPALAEE